VGNAPFYSWEYYPGSPPKLGASESGFYMPAVLGEWSCRSEKGILALCEQRELRDIPVARRQVLYPATSAWWASVEVPRDMAARVSQMVGLQGSQRMGETLGGPYHIIFVTLWPAEVANEKLHGSCKRMFKWSNKRGPGVALQMMRCDESQSAIIRELIDADEDFTAPTVGVGPTPRSCRIPARNGDSPGRGGGGDGGDDGAGAAATTSGVAADGHGSPAATSPLTTAALTFTGRAQRMAIGDLRKIAELETLGGALDLENREHVTVHNTVRIMAKFEWGAAPSLQHLRASERFFGRLWYSFVRYVSMDGFTR